VAEIDEAVERNETVAKMKADFERRLCDLEMQIISLPELTRGQFEDTSNTLPVKITGIAGTFVNTNPHSTDEHKSDENLTATLAHRLKTLEENVDLIASILTRMEDSASSKHAEKPHACSKSRQFHETGSTCFPIAEDE